MKSHRIIASAFFSLLFTSSVVFAVTPTPPAPTPAAPTPAVSASQSDRWLWLESDSPQRQAWISQRLTESGAILQRSTNKSRFEDYARQTFDRERDIRSVVLRAGGVLRLVDRGLNRPTELLLHSNRGAEVIFSNSRLAANNSFTFRNFNLNADETLLGMVFVRHGSTDEWRLVVIDIPNRAVVRESIIAGSDAIVWQNNDSFLYEERVAPTTLDVTVRAWNKNAPQTSTAVPSLSGIDACGGEVCVVYDTAQEARLLRRTGDSLFIPQGFSFQAVIGSFGDQYFFRVGTATGFQDIVALRNIAGAFDPAPVSYYAPVNEIIDSAWLDNGDLFVISHWGADQFATVVRGPRQVIAKVTLPNFANPKAFWWSQANSELEFRLDSNVLAGVRARYNLATSAWSTDLNAALLRVSSVQLTSRTLQCPGLDGTLIPTAVTYRANPTAAYIEVYGGFNNPSSTYPAARPMMIPFFMRGGVFVAPAVRGGNEFGRAWHHAARFENKTVTYDDVIATSRCVQREFGIHPSRIAIMGISNGGLTVAATALRSPQDFGLSIPGNGVHDLLGKERLDERFYSGWDYEYGDSRIPAHRAYLETFSPVEQVIQVARGGTVILPKFLIINGRQDTRVNPAHSFKLLAALKDAYAGSADPQAGDRFQMISTNNSGHSNSSATYQDLIGWRVNATMWTWIFDHLGWQL